MRLVRALVDGYNDRHCGYRIAGMPEIMDGLHENRKYERFLNDRSISRKLSSTAFERRYFSDMSTAYLYGSDTYPQTASGVRGFDKKTYDLLEAMWSK